VIKAWSPSRLVDYETCPAKANYKYVLRLPEPPAPALDRGTRIHKEAEEYILGTQKRVTLDLRGVKTELARLRGAYRKGRVRVEQALAFTSGWKPTDWFAKDAWLRCKIDVVEEVPSRRKLARIARVTDWKSGKNNARDAEKHGDQLNLYSLAILSSGIAEESSARLVFTDTGEFVEKPEGSLTTADVLTAREKWGARVEPMMTDTTFEPNPNFTCRWCAFAKAQGGPCRF
jgi:CRISPR/Cas system-associated exonuclease Cas4 (RecB family)